jgi:hypothetical protein
MWGWTPRRDGSISDVAISPIASALQNLGFLASSTNYLTRKELTELVTGHFGDVRFVEEHVWKHNCGKTGFLYRTLSRIRLESLASTAARLVSPFARRALNFEKPREESP